ncbi:hypothetical protein [Pararhodobacter marinus]|uniref:hypothetical protein n=1 Tax=Pararhodobacter marinus TaxID=2184063 RepID=UPI003515BD34
MSDPMSNREIEDVLTSIRRLVAQEGDRGAENGRLILTEAHRVSEQVRALGGEHEEAAALVERAAKGDDVTIPAPDFSKLEATIAELEAAVSGVEGEGAEAKPVHGPAPSKPSNVTELYGKMSFSHQPVSAANAAQPDPAGPDSSQPDADQPAPAEGSLATENAAEVEPAALAPDAAPEVEAKVEAAPAPEDAVTAGPGDEIDEDGLADTILDEEELRQFVAQIVREELRGQLGERITQQVRKLVRAEIAKVLEERDLF